jgi:hypothetical protein
MDTEGIHMTSHYASRRTFLVASLAAGLIAAAGCASAGVGSVPVSSFDGRPLQRTLAGPGPILPEPLSAKEVIVQSDLRRMATGSADDAIRRLRPIFFNTRGSRLPLVVYLDNLKLGGTESLRDIQIQGLREIRHLDGITATAYYGPGHTGGVIVLRTVR